jgi:hypothetical protein
MEERQQMMHGKVSQLEEGHRKNNILIFGLQERKEEGYFDTLGDVMKFLRESMRLRVSNTSTDYAARLGRREQRPISVKRTSFSMTLGVLEVILTF